MSETTLKRKRAEFLWFQDPLGVSEPSSIALVTRVCNATEEARRRVKLFLMSLQSNSQCSPKTPFRIEMEAASSLRGHLVLPEAMSHMGGDFFQICVQALFIRALR